MFDGNVLKEKSFKNITEAGKTTGFEVQTNITYYRGIPLSMINNIRVFVDGREVPREDIRFSVDKVDWFTLDELKTVTSYKWEYNVAATVRVLQDGGLAKGKHDIKLNVITRTAYIPIPLSGERTETFDVQ
ncbi:C-glycoside deglycosidase beta subunit domain-containing protein [Enterococcus durans]|uniref:C-deglycosylation enzyme beta subunit n=1 Tax=Enterococcus durans TaxID=53345 RepID=A0A367CFP2_9ENTE|nr:DUF6379 domain-containing protein [Enterococcus durans]RCA11202.1 hypothetical protein EA71_01957 [Enterococcus durans]